MSDTEPPNHPQPPSSQQIQQALNHLASLSSLLDSKSPPPSDDLQQQPSTSRFPGLVEILPHLLAPLTDLNRLQAAAAGTGPNPGQGGLLNKHIGSAPLQSGLRIQPSNSLATYHPLISQVALILSQVITQIRDPQAPQGRTREAIEIAEVVLQSQGKRGTPGEGLSIEEKRQIIISRRKRRRERHQSKDDHHQVQPAPAPEAPSSSARANRNLSFDAQVTAYAPSEAEVARLRHEDNGIEHITGCIQARLKDIRKDCRAFDDARAEAISTAMPPQQSKSQNDRLQLWLARMVPEKARSPSEGEAGSEQGGKICHGIVRARLPSVGDGLVWFECRREAGGWHSTVTKVNLRTTAEIDSEDSLLKANGISQLHLPSASKILKELTTSTLRCLSVNSSVDQDPLASITRAIIAILALRSLYKSPPPTLEQLSMSRQRDIQLEMLTGVEMSSEKDKQMRVGVAEWLDLAGGAGDAAGVQWAWCCKEGEAEDADRGQWLAFVNSGNLTVN